MPDDTDAVDEITQHLGDLYPELDASAMGVTGRILRLAQEVGARRNQHLAPHGLTFGEFDVLASARRIEGDEGVNPRRLLESVLITSGGMTKRLDRLEQAGLIERRPDPHDRRGTLIKLTPEGLSLIDELVPSLLEMERQTLLARLTRRQVAETSSLLRRIGTSLSADPA